MIPELAEMTRMPIERATSIVQIIERSSLLIGAPVAGLLIAVMGTENVLWLDAASFFISAGIIAFAVKGHQLEPQKEDKPTGKYFDELRDGLRFIFNDKLVLAIVILIMATNFLDAVFGGVVRPVFVKEVYGQALDLGLLIAANGGGAVIGGVLTEQLGTIPMLIGIGTIYMVTTLSAAVFPLMREMDRKELATG